jgi:hypothetical protein
LERGKKSSRHKLVQAVLPDDATLHDWIGNANWKGRFVVRLLPSWEVRHYLDLARRGTTQ